MPELAAPDGASDFYFVEAADAEDAAAKIVKVVAERIPARFGLDAIRDVQVLCPMNRGAPERGPSTCAAGRAQPAPRRRARRGALRLHLPHRRQGHADREQLRPRHLQRRSRASSRAIDEEEAEIIVDFDGRAVALPIRRARRGDAGLRDHHPQVAGLRVSGRRDPGRHPALHHAAAQSALHRD